MSVPWRSACGAWTAFGPTWEKAYPAAVACLVENFASLSVHLRFPAEPAVNPLT
ncbi:MAG: hypothetical protein ACLP36_12005 [Acidimicrobiales bacterium]